MPIVIDDESDDDLPLFARPVARMPANKDGPGEREEPDWMKSFKSPTSQALNADDDSDDGIMDIFQRHKTEEKFEMKSTPAKMVRSPPANAPKVEDEDKDDADVEDEPIEIDDDDDDDDDDEAVGDGDGDDDDEEPAAKTKPKTPTPKKLGPQSANADRASVRAQAEKTAGTSTPNRPGEVPLFMPSAVNRNKVFFELEGTGEAVDLVSSYQPELIGRRLVPAVAVGLVIDPGDADAHRGLLWVERWRVSGRRFGAGGGSTTPIEPGRDRPGPRRTASSVRGRQAP